jgi:hypothetical protein
MAKGGSAFDDIVKAVMAQIAKNRPEVVSAAKSTVDDAGKLASSAASAVKKALGKSKPKVASKTAKTVTPKPSKSASKPMTKAERRLVNQRAEAERQAAIADGSAARAKAKAERKAKNREKFIKEEKKAIDERYTARTQRRLANVAINQELGKKFDSLEAAERLLGNRSGSFEDKLDYVFKKRLEQIKSDGYVLDKKELKILKTSIAEDLKEKAIRTKTNLTPAIADRIEKLKKMSPAELDTEGARMAFRRNLKDVKTGRVPKDTRSSAEIVRERRITEQYEAAEAAKADKARNRVTSNTSRPKKELTAEEIAENKRFYQKNKRNTSKPKPTKTPSPVSAEYDRSFGRPPEFLSKNPPKTLPERNAFGMTREEFAAYKAKQAKGARVPKKK